MSSSYGFIIDGIRFSYSSVSTYTTCPYSFKLSYIDVKPRENNFYGQYGTLIHECFEKYFSGEIESMELSQYYRENYSRVVDIPAPTTPFGLGEKYKLQGQDFYDMFSFNKDDYQVLLVEDKIDFSFNSSLMVAKPDLILRDKATGKTVLFDYKTATPYRTDKHTGKEIADTKKLKGYYKQMFLYAYALRTERGVPIDEITLWYTRLNRQVTIPWALSKEEESLAWFEENIAKIKEDEEFSFNISNPYFCNNLCSVREYCEYR
jgi:hypothetical protein